MTHIIYIKTETVIRSLTKANTKYTSTSSSIAVQDAHTHARTHAHTHARTHVRTHTHTHMVQIDRGEGQCCLTEIFGEEKCLEFAFEGRENGVYKSLTSSSRLAWCKSSPGTAPIVITDPLSVVCCKSSRFARSDLLSVQWICVNVAHHKSQRFTGSSA